MKWFIRRFVPVLVWAVLELNGGHALRAESVQATSLVESNNAFALELYGHLRNAPGNLFFSPFSISTCLALTYAGARGETESQMARVLHFPSDRQQFNAAFSELGRQLNRAGEQETELDIANALWTQTGHAFLPAFLETCQGQYQAKLNQIDFQTEAQKAADEINRWVAAQTKGKITEILAPGNLNAQTRLVVVDAIYFKGLWATPFAKTQTSTQPFHLAGGGQDLVPLMHHVDRVAYFETNDFQAVELPYHDKRMAMVVILPREPEGCFRLEKRLTPALLSSALGQMKSQKVELFLPRFKLESRFDLNTTLSGMGMTDAFGRQADFSGIDGSRQLYISGIYHKAWGEVNEQGTEAAAATGVGFAAMAVQKPPAAPPIFRADHPFIFFIRDSRSGSLIFMGRLMNPKDS